MSETAADTLKMLSTDNDRLSQRRVPWVLIAGFGAVAAWFVAAAAITTPAATTSLLQPYGWPLS